MKKNNTEIIRIAHIIGKWLGGGVEAVVMNYYRNIDRNKFQFDFICDNDSTDIPYDEIARLGGKVILIPPYQNVIKYHQELKNVLKNGNYKIIHSHINTLSIFSLFAASCAHVPVRIAHSHSTTNKKETKKNILKQVFRPFSRVFATNYMACSEYAGIWLFGKNAYNKGKIYVLNNAIDLKQFKYNEKLRNSKRKELNIDDNTLVIGHVGRFVEQKNHRFLIDIFSNLNKKNPNTLLLLVGQGPLMDSMKEKVKSLTLERKVLFLGQRNDIADLYQAMDVFCLPSLYEGLGMVAVEAQASRIPCIVSDEIPKVAKVSNSISFLKLSDDVNIWSNEINYYLNKTSENKKFKFKNLDRYDIKLEVSNLEKYYLDVYNGRKR